MATIFDNTTFLSFQDLTQKYSIGKDQFLVYIQIKNAIKTKMDISFNKLQQPQNKTTLKNIETPQQINSMIAVPKLIGKTIYPFPHMKISGNKYVLIHSQ